MAISGKNISKGDNVASLPSAYRLQEIVLTNYKGEEKDIQNIAVKMSITESIYSQSLLLNLTLKDSSNLVEDFPIIGQEKIQVKIEYSKKNKRTGEDKLKSLNLKFYITEYPIFGSTPSQAYTQIIRLVGISEQSYISNQKKIVKSYNNNTAKEIEDILKNELNLPEKKFKSSIDPYLSISSSKGIINRQRPMDAIEWLRKQSHDQYQSPFYFFQTLNGKYRLFSLASMFDDEVNKVFNTYYDRRESTNKNADAGSEEDYQQREQTILSVASNLKLNKSIQSRRGAFASRNNFLDYSNKTYTTEDYDYSENFLTRKPTLEKHGTISDQFKIGDENLTDFKESHCEYISLNHKAFGDKNTWYNKDEENPSVESNYNNMSKGSRQFLNAYQALLNTMTHDIRLNGNFKLNAGKKIKLMFPKAIDPSVYSQYTDNEKDLNGHVNNLLSGKYLITSVVHEFEDDEYFVDVRVKRDSFSIELK